VWQHGEYDGRRSGRTYGREILHACRNRRLRVHQVRQRANSYVNALLTTCAGRRIHRAATAVSV